MKEHDAVKEAFKQLSEFSQPDKLIKRADLYTFMRYVGKIPIGKDNVWSWRRTVEVTVPSAEIKEAYLNKSGYLCIPFEVQS